MYSCTKFLPNFSRFGQLQFLRPHLLQKHFRVEYFARDKKLIDGFI